MKKGFYRIFLGSVLALGLGYSSSVFAIKSSGSDVASGAGMAAAGVGASLGVKSVIGGLTSGNWNPFSGCELSLGTLGGDDFIPYHTGFLGFSFDIGSAAGRVLTTAVKYFLSDDTDLVAELVWNEKSDSGCGGCYKKTGCTATSNSKFLVDSQDISIEDEIYREGKTLTTTCLYSLAQDRLEECAPSQASIDERNEITRNMQRQSQRRSIQAMTDALNMKRLYRDIKDVATSGNNNYSDYPSAMGTVASKRLLLDQLLALKKRVVAARLRLRAQTLEWNSVDLKLITQAPNLIKSCEK